MKITKVVVGGSLKLWDSGDYGYTTGSDMSATMELGPEDSSKDVLKLIQKVRMSMDETLWDYEVAKHPKFAKMKDVLLDRARFVVKTKVGGKSDDDVS